MHNADGRHLLAPPSPLSVAGFFTVSSSLPPCFLRPRPSSAGMRPAALTRTRNDKSTFVSAHLTYTYGTYTKKLDQTCNFRCSVKIWSLELVGGTLPFLSLILIASCLCCFHLHHFESERARATTCSAPGRPERILSSAFRTEERYSAAMVGFI